MITEFSLDSSIKVADFITAVDVQDEIILMNVNNDAFYGLNRVASVMWETLQTADTIGDALVQLKERYDVSAEQITADFMQFIDELQSQGFITIEDN